MVSAAALSVQTWLPLRLRYAGQNGTPASVEHLPSRLQATVSVSDTAELVVDPAGHAPAAATAAVIGPAGKVLPGSATSTPVDPGLDVVPSTPDDGSKGLKQQASGAAEPPCRQVLLPKQPLPQPIMAGSSGHSDHQRSGLGAMPASAAVLPLSPILVRVQPPQAQGPPGADPPRASMSGPRPVGTLCGVPLDAAAPPHQLAALSLAEKLQRWSSAGSDPAAIDLAATEPAQAQLQEAGVSCATGPAAAPFASPAQPPAPTSVSHVPASDPPSIAGSPLDDAIAAALESVERKHAAQRLPVEAGPAHAAQPAMLPGLYGGVAASAMHQGSQFPTAMATAAPPEDHRPASAAPHPPVDQVHEPGSAQAAETVVQAPFPANRPLLAPASGAGQQPPVQPMQPHVQQVPAGELTFEPPGAAGTANHASGSGQASGGPATVGPIRGGPMEQPQSAKSTPMSEGFLAAFDAIMEDMEKQRAPAEPGQVAAASVNQAAPGAGQPVTPRIGGAAAGPVLPGAVAAPRPSPLPIKHLTFTPVATEDHTNQQQGPVMLAPTFSGVHAAPSQTPSMPWQQTRKAGQQPQQQQPQAGLAPAAPSITLPLLAQQPSEPAWRGRGSRDLPSIPPASIPPPMPWQAAQPGQPWLAQPQPYTGACLAPQGATAQLSIQAQGQVTRQLGPDAARGGDQNGLWYSEASEGAGPPGPQGPAQHQYQQLPQQQPQPPPSAQEQQLQPPHLAQRQPQNALPVGMDGQAAAPSGAEVGPAQGQQGPGEAADEADDDDRDSDDVPLGMSQHATQARMRIIAGSQLVGATAGITPRQLSLSGALDAEGEDPSAVR